MGDSNNNPRPSGGGLSSNVAHGADSSPAPSESQGGKMDSPREGGTRFKGKNPPKPPTPARH